LLSAALDRHLTDAFRLSCARLNKQFCLDLIMQNKKLVRLLPLLLSLVALVCLPTRLAAQTPAALTVKYTSSTDDSLFERDQYFIELLKLAAEKSNVPLQLIPVRLPDQVETRDIINLNKGIIDVHWMHTSNKLELSLTPVPVPLDRGLFGWRMILLDKKNSELLKDVQSLVDLRQFTVVQGYDWPDTPILAANGFKVETSTNRQALFRMLQRNRAELFPRSILEVWGEIEDKRNSSLVLDTHLLVYYPTCFYFFTAKENKALAAALEYGLNRAVDDGSLQALFHRYYDELINKANLQERQVIRLNNPLLPPATPLQKPEYWLLPEEYLIPKQPDVETVE
jgi:hypothetical protein